MRLRCMLKRCQGRHGCLCQSFTNRQSQAPAATRGRASSDASDTRACRSARRRVLMTPHGYSELPVLCSCGVRLPRVAVGTVHKHVCWQGWDHFLDSSGETSQLSGSKVSPAVCVGGSGSITCLNKLSVTRLSSPAAKR